MSKPASEASLQRQIAGSQAVNVMKDELERLIGITLGPLNPFFLPRRGGNNSLVYVSRSFNWHVSADTQNNITLSVWGANGALVLSKTMNPKCRLEGPNQKDIAAIRAEFGCFQAALVDRYPQIKPAIEVFEALADFGKTSVP